MTDPGVVRFGALPRRGTGSDEDAPHMSTLGNEPRRVTSGRRGRPEHDRVQTDMEVGLELSDRCTVPLLARFTYRSDEPYSAHLVFHLLGREPVPWVLARELLTTGLARPSGDGDVRVWLNGDREVLHLSLDSADGHALLEVPSAPLARWLVHTERLVPQGGESRFLDIDAALKNLLHETRPPASDERHPPDDIARPEEDTIE